MYNLSEITNTILCGDAKEELSKIPDESIDTIITSPPYYALRDYQVKGQLGLEKSFDEYKTKLLEIIAEIKRVLKPTGCFFLNLGDIYGGTRWSGKGVGQPINKFRDGYRDINPIRGFDKKNYGGPGKKRQDTMRQGRGRGGGDASKCLMMMPERITIAMCDQQGWILRNRVCWAKQILDFKEKRTKGSVMPSSVKDRFNESWEYLYFFVKNKKYYSNLDAVRLLPQVRFVQNYHNFGPGKDNPNNWKSMAKFNYRVRDAERKEGQPQFKASEKEIKRYNEIPEDYGKKKLIGLDDKKLGNRWMSGTPNFVKQNKVNDPRGNHEGGPGSWRENLDNPKYREYYEKKKKREKIREYGLEINATWNKSGDLYNPLGKNLPTVWLIGSEPHNFKNELGVEVDHFATFPRALCELPVKFGCPEKGIVLDPFGGSMTVALVAEELNRNWIMIELNKDYCKLGQKRIYEYRKKEKSSLFDDLTKVVPPPIMSL